jgi:glycosyltransferase involved in cell wall biosynthesis
MKVLFVSTWYPFPPDNGSKVRVFHLLKALATRHEVTLVSLLPMDGHIPAQDLVELGLCREVVVVPQAPFESSRLRRLLGWFSPVPSHLWAAESPALPKQLDELLQEQTYDVVIASNLPVARAVAALPVATRVLEEHNFSARLMAESLQHAVGPGARARAWLRLRKDEAFALRLFRRFNLVTMASEDDAAAAQRVCGPAIDLLVVPNGVDVAACAAVAAEPQPGLVVYPGAVTYAANWDAVQWFVRDIWPAVRARHPAARFVVTGRTDGVAIDVCAAEPGVSFAGYVDDLRSLLASAWATVIPLRQGGGSRIKVLEALALGSPVVSTSKGVEGLDLRPAAHYLLADDAASFAARTAELLADATLRQRLSEAGRAQVAATADWAPIGAAFTAAVTAVAAGATRGDGGRD